MRFLITMKTGFSPEMNEKLAALGFEIDYLETPERARDDLDFSDVEALLCYRFLNYNDIRRFPALRYIHTTSAGLDHMPLDYIREKGIALYNAGGVYSIPMAEFALGGVLQLYKNAPRFRAQQTAHVWQQGGKNRELGGKNVCIVGAGSIGTETAKRFSAMGCRVTGLRRNPVPMPYFDEVLHIERLDACLPEADIVILTVPLSDETYHLFDAARFARMKDGAVCVNISRGAVVETQALCAALESKKLYGAVIDVTEEEPLPPDSPLWDLENAIITPHYSFNGEFNPQRMFELVYADTKKWLESQKENG